MDRMTPLLARWSERLVIALIGALSIYLGYLLCKMPLGQLSDAELAFGKSATFIVRRVGPGFFFALFGAAIVGFSLKMQMRFIAQEPSPSPASLPGAKDGTVLRKTPGGSSFLYAVLPGGVFDNQAVQSARSQLIIDFRTLDQLCSAIASADAEERVVISKEDRADFRNAVPRVKQALMSTVWEDDWGDYAAFTSWVRGDQSETPPEGLEAPTRFYLDQIEPGTKRF